MSQGRDPALASRPCSSRQDARRASPSVHQRASPRLLWATGNRHPGIDRQDASHRMPPPAPDGSQVGAIPSVNSRWLAAISPEDGPCAARDTGLVRAKGLEPSLLSEPDPKSGASANSATRATLIHRDLRKPARPRHGFCTPLCTPRHGRGGRQGPGGTGESRESRSKVHLGPSRSTWDRRHRQTRNLARLPIGAPRCPSRK